MIYNRSMSPYLPHPTYPRTHFSTNFNISRVVAVGMLVIVICAQLMTFEKFIPLLNLQPIFIESQSGIIVATLIVTIEVFALPVLLRMALSPLLRIISFICGIFVIFLWLFWLINSLILSDPMLIVPIFGSIFQNVLWLTSSFAAILIVLLSVSLWALRKDLS